jgi:hypothetical protein
MQVFGDFRLSTSKSRPVPPTVPARETEGKEELRTVSYVDNVASFWCDITDLDDTHSKHSGGAASSSTTSAPSLYNNSYLLERASTHPSTASSVTSEKSLADCYAIASTPPGLERENYCSEHLLGIWQPWLPSEDTNWHTSRDVIWHPSGDVDPKPIGGYTGNQAASSSQKDVLNQLLESFTAADLSVGAEVKENGKKENGKSGTTLVDQVFTELGASIPRELLEAIHARGLLEKIPRNEHQQLTSIGSIGHSIVNDVQCRPCLFWFRGRCSKGILCEFCHYVHEGQRPKRIRAAKNTRLKMRDGEMPKAFAI